MDVDGPRAGTFSSGMCVSTSGESVAHNAVPAGLVETGSTQCWDVPVVVAEDQEPPLARADPQPSSTEGSDSRRKVEHTLRKRPETDPRHPRPRVDPVEERAPLHGCNSLSSHPIHATSS